jgi:hypothetical protein
VSPTRRTWRCGPPCSTRSSDMRRRYLQQSCRSNTYQPIAHLRGRPRALLRCTHRNPSRATPGRAFHPNPGALPRPPNRAGSPEPVTSPRSAMAAGIGKPASIVTRSPSPMNRANSGPAPVTPLAARAWRTSACAWPTHRVTESGRTALRSTAVGQAVSSRAWMTDAPTRARSTRARATVLTVPRGVAAGQGRRSRQARDYRPVSATRLRSPCTLHAARGCGPP